MKQVNDKYYLLFRKISLTTLIAVYFLILVGGVVRSTGSGMGCPDWPKCFGKIIPPTSEQELPDNYQEIYAQKRAKKNERFSEYLDRLGFSTQANRIRNDQSILVEARFNKYKTWTEYVNRLIGAVIGLFIFATVVASWPLRKHRPKLFYLSLATFVLVGFQGWIGSIVVSTNLLSWMVTLHMIIAMLIMFLLIYLVVGAKKEAISEINVSAHIGLKWFFIVSLVLTFLQVVMGTQVREMVDEVAVELGESVRNTWIENLGLMFLIHRSYSLIILGVHLYLIYFLKKNESLINNKSGLMVKLLVGAVVVEILSGVIMAYFSIPAILQPIHLLVALIIVGIQFYLVLMTRKSKEVAAIKATE